jgi:two-component system CheB/CheR fusion protein
VGEALSQAVEACKAMVVARGQTLVLSLPPDRLYLYADTARFEQVVTNLLTNASKYTGAGGTISVSLEAATSAAGAPLIVLRVRDTGAGIAPELLPRVFDLFIQAERTLARSEGGLGIGLTMVRRLVEMHGGTVEAHSEGLGRGSEFVVWLPAIDPPDTEATVSRVAHTSGAPVAPPRRKTVLIVEDNPDASQSLGELLELWGHSVCHAVDGESALRLAPSVKPDVVLLDIGLPGIDGYEVAAQLRRSGSVEGATLIALTGYGREEDRRRAGAAGFDRHLTKPLDPDLLRSVLAEVPFSC